LRAERPLDHDTEDFQRAETGDQDEDGACKNTEEKCDYRRKAAKEYFGEPDRLFRSLPCFC
jgi:hypothetical protein